nr:MAG TPA: hypothetical protein [Caudoviricetes sp.]
MTLKEVIEYWELFNAEIAELLYLYCSDAACKKTLEEQREATEFTIAALREQREEFMPPCYQPDGDGCAYQIYGPDDDEPIERCKACPLCYSDKMRHHGPKTPCDLCLYNPPSSGNGKPCTMCPASSLPEPLIEPAEAKHGCDFAKEMGFSSCDKCPIDCDIRQMPKENT